MAVDTRNKRASVLKFDTVGRVYPNPDGSLANSNDRAHVGMEYAGIPANAVGGSNKIPWHLFFRRVV